MSTFIDRDPKQMMAFGKSAQELIGEMVKLINGIQGVLVSAEKDLDKKSQEEVRQLQECCKDYLKKIDVYSNISKEIYDKGKRLDNIRNGGN